MNIVSLSEVSGQAKSKNEKLQYAFIMVINKESTKFYFSPVFKFEVDKRGNAICNLTEKETEYRGKVADAKFDAITSDYFDTKEEAEQARDVTATSKRKPDIL